MVIIQSSLQVILEFIQFILGIMGLQLQDLAWQPSEQYDADPSHLVRP